MNVQVIEPAPTDTRVFLGFVQHFLVSELEPGDIVVRDMLRHKVKGVAAIEAAGAQAWYLPPYSSDLNPIERMWSKVKAVFRSFVCRSVPNLYRAIGTAPKRVARQEYTNYFSNCGHPLQ